MKNFLTVFALSCCMAPAYSFGQSAPQAPAFSQWVTVSQPNSSGGIDGDHRQGFTFEEAPTSGGWLVSPIEMVTDDNSRSHSYTVGPFPAGVKSISFFLCNSTYSIDWLNNVILKSTPPSLEVPYNEDQYQHLNMSIP